MDVPCTHCGEPLSRPPSRIKANAQFCDHACHTAYQQRSRVQVVCVICGEGIARAPSVATRTTEPVCGETCRRVFLSRMQIRVRGSEERRNATCPHCGKNFTRKPSQLAKYAASYCSRECKRLAMTGPRPDRTNGEWLPCETCGKQVWRTPATRGAHVFCSMACTAVGQDRRAGIRKVLYIAAVCPQCGIEFESIPSRAKRAKKLYCSAACKSVGEAERLRVSPQATKGRPGTPWPDSQKQRLSETLKAKYQAEWQDKGAHHSVRMTGTGNPAWQDGASLAPYEPGFTRTVKRAVLKRDGNRCRICGSLRSKDNPLPIHHFDGGKIDHSLTNLIALCHHCHGLVHGGKLSCPTP